MKELVVISGKGGTGKTSLAASFAVLAKRSVMADCDVDAADLHLLLHPVITQKEVFISGTAPRRVDALCIHCGKCIRLCRYGAIGPDYGIDSFACEGCGVCADNCPEKAIVMKEKERGDIFISETAWGPMVHARLGIGEENSGKMVTRVRKLAREIAQNQTIPLIIADGSPGIGCPVIASIGGCSLAIVVCEPTVSGLHDTRRVLELAEHFNVPSALVINKSDLNPEGVESLKRLCSEHSVPLLGEIRYNRQFNEAIIRGIPLVEMLSSGGAEEIGEIWDKIMNSDPMRAKDGT
jgi:MinD superfamily P-loop ATPase